MVADAGRRAPPVVIYKHRSETFEQQESHMPILLWLLGLPIGLIIILMLLGVA